MSRRTIKAHRPCDSPSPLRDTDGLRQRSQAQHRDDAENRPRRERSERPSPSHSSRERAHERDRRRRQEEPEADLHRQRGAQVARVGQLGDALFHIEDGIDLPAKKIGSNDELWRDHAPESAGNALAALVKYFPGEAPVYVEALTSVGQVYPRSLDFDVLSALVQLTAAPSNLATTIRLMAGNEIVTRIGMAASGAKYGINLQPGGQGSWQTVMPFAWSAGANLTTDDDKQFTFDTPEMQEGLKYYQSFFTEKLADADPRVAAAIAAELKREQTQIELIASENIVSRAVLEAQGSVLTNKYAEGYPGRRYYQGCGPSDSVETLAIERAKKLFGAQFANVQPNSGSQMNQAVFLALLQPGDTFMGLDLNSVGHLTHGSPVNISGKWFKPVSYGVRREDELIDMDQVAATAREQVHQRQIGRSVHFGQLAWVRRLANRLRHRA